jgi:hypothetical protein
MFGQNSSILNETHMCRAQTAAAHSAARQQAMRDALDSIEGAVRAILAAADAFPGVNSAAWRVAAGGFFSLTDLFTDHFSMQQSWLAEAIRAIQSLQHRYEAHTMAQGAVAALQLLQQAHYSPGRLVHEARMIDFFKMIILVTWSHHPDD